MNHEPPRGPLARRGSKISDSGLEGGSPARLKSGQLQACWNLLNW
jgi:hypothetical protein